MARIEGFPHSESAFEDEFKDALICVKLELPVAALKTPGFYRNERTVTKLDDDNGSVRSNDFERLQGKERSQWWHEAPPLNPRRTRSLALASSSSGY
jgi:hypothetical protein